MFNHNLFLNEKQQEDLSVTVKNALEAWENGIFAWSAWVGEFLAHQNGVTLSRTQNVRYGISAKKFASLPEQKINLYGCRNV